MSIYRVLVVDDNFHNRVVFREIFEHLGCAVNAVDCGEAALASLATNVYDLICLDRFMPGMSGDQLVARLPHDLFVVAWSTDPSNLPARYDAVLEKPISIPAAARIITRAVRHKASPISHRLGRK